MLESKALFTTRFYLLRHLAVPGSSRMYFKKMHGAADAFPQLSLMWSKPFTKAYASGATALLVPRLQAITGTTGLNKGKSPNEDSLDLELNEANMFNLNRFPGQDWLDEGSRVNYGLDAQYTEEYYRLKAFFGQSFALQKSTFPNDPQKRGLNKGFSDFFNIYNNDGRSLLRFFYSNRKCCCRCNTCAYFYIF